MTTEPMSRNDLSQSGLPTNMTLFSYLTGVSRTFFPYQRCGGHDSLS
jgi:hypothetical protein